MSNQLVNSFLTSCRLRLSLPPHALSLMLLAGLFFCTLSGSALHATPISIGGDGGGGSAGGGGGSTSGPITQPAATPGPAYSWEGSVGDVKTGNGNKLTSLPIVSWIQAGGLPIAFTLNHNSESSRNGELGPKWTTSYDISLTADSSGNNVTAFWGDGSAYTFTRVGNSFAAPPGVHDALVYRPNPISATAPGSYELITKDQVHYNFFYTTTPTHFIISTIIDKNFNEIQFSYDSSNKLYKIVDQTGYSISLAYDASNRLNSIIDPKNRQWTIAYTNAGDLWYVTEPAVPFAYNYRAFAYNAAHDITQTQDRNNNQAYLGYNADNSTAWKRDSLGNQTNFSYGTTATTITDPNNHTTIHTYNNSGQLASVTDALGYTEYYSYDGANNVTQKQDRRGFAWNNTYDGMGNVLTAADPNNNTTTTTYNSHNRPLKVTLPLGRSVTNTYDGSDNLTQALDKDAHGNAAAVTNYAYNSYGQLYTKSDAYNRITYYTYGGGYLSAVKTPLGHLTQWTYDALGFQTSRTDALSRTTTYTPDAWERRGLHP